MDKYINKSGSHQGLDLIANYKKHEIDDETRNIKYTHEYDAILVKFKQIISNKLTRFEPSKIRDTYDDLLLYLWYHFIIGNRSKSNIVQLFNLLDISDMSDTSNSSNT